MRMFEQGVERSGPVSFAPQVSYSCTHLISSSFQIILISLSITAENPRDNKISNHSKIDRNRVFVPPRDSKMD